MTMFGYPPNYLFSDEMRKVLRKCEKLKNTVRNSPREYSSWNLRFGTSDREIFAAVVAVAYPFYFVTSCRRIPKLVV